MTTPDPSDVQHTLTVPDHESRTVYFNDPSRKGVFCSNKISTGKYKTLTFLPIFLYVQFGKAFNIFFLLISVIQQIPNVSPTAKFTTALPLAIILTVAALKEIVEDYSRHKQDRLTNQRKCKVYSSGKKQFEPKLWHEIEVGDVVHLGNESFFPADIVLLSTSEPEGLCYIETANLDGETNLKVRQALRATDTMKSENEVNCVSGSIVCDLPNRHLYMFNGKINLEHLKKEVPLGPEQILLRGSKLRNTRYVYGVVVYTGHESKLMKNANKAPLKMSSVDKLANKQIWIMLVVLILLSLSSTYGAWNWQSRWGNADVSGAPWYISFAVNTSGDLIFLQYFLYTLTFMVLYNNIVPISLLVTLEVVKYIQAIFINSDTEMRYEKTNTSALARTSNLNEELGQIKYIFTDKTGTLTQNLMEFRKASVAGVKYEDNSKAHGFNDPKFMQLAYNTESELSPVKSFVLAMTICHTVVPEHDNQQSDHDKIKYQASSPDESALVEAARNLGCIFVDRTPTHILINAWGKDLRYEILNVLDFSSSRKRMSVIVREPGGRLTLYCKGADNVIYQRLDDHQPNQYKEETIEHLRQFAVDGLRTLCFGRAYLDQTIYQQWNDGSFYTASTAINNRDKKLEESYEVIEKKLHLLGASAIEDELQEGVPQTIANLAQADIKLWVLTGDKVETAVNIAFSCNLLTSDLMRIVLDEKSLEGTASRLSKVLPQIAKERKNDGPQFALIVTGSCLLHCLHSDVQSDFLRVALSCKSVLCCRVSPSQKAEVVELVKSNCKAITLAIGDGANDVSMIQAAHVGVGISGCEGLQAANSSDYSIAQFAYLEKLLLVHGAWNYDRLTKCILYSFYKNICLYLIQLWYLFYNGFSAQIFFDSWMIAMYNVVFTLLPPFTIGLFERMCTKKSMLMYPQLYTLSQRSMLFNSFIFWKMCLNAVFHSVLLFFLPMMSFNHDVLRSDGKTGNYLYLGNFVYAYVVVTVSLKAGMETSTWTMFTFLSLILSVGSWFIIMLIYSSLYPAFSFAADMSGQGVNVMNSPPFWFGLLLMPCIALFKDVVWKALRTAIKPTIADIVQSQEASNRKFSRNLRLNRPSSKKVDKTFHGYAFSQEENGVVAQAELIRSYDTTSSKSS